MTITIKLNSEDIKVNANYFLRNSTLKEKIIKYIDEHQTLELNPCMFKKDSSKLKDALIGLSIAQILFNSKKQ